jgi:hypothetical protein
MEAIVNALVGEGLQYLTYYEGLEQGTCHGSGACGVSILPSCKITGKAGVAEVEFRRLDCTVQGTVGKGPEDEDDSGSFKK